jgi:hypothetical protein
MVDDSAASLPEFTYISTPTTSTFDNGRTCIGPHDLQFIRIVS